MSAFVLKFSQIGKGDIALVGGKGANLGELVQAGLPVPPGFCLTVDAYHQHLKANKIQPIIDKLLSELDQEDINHLQVFSARIRELIESAPIPSQIEREAVEAYQEMGHPAVAVRSSATAEDLPEASFAGQLESFLNIVNESDLMESIRKCWGSLWTPRAIHYRYKQSFDHSQVGLAVVIQQMIQATVSGIMFTANPVSGQDDEIVINSAYGLGESIVDGTVIPDMFVIDKTSLRVKNQVIATKEFMKLSNSNATGVKDMDVAVEIQAQSSLDDQTVVVLAQLGVKVEQYFGAAQDIEWAFTDMDLYLLQSRPITGIKREQVTIVDKRYNSIQRIILGFLLDYFPAPPYPFDRSIMLDLVNGALKLADRIGLTFPDSDQLFQESELGLMQVYPVLPKPTLSVAILPILVLREIYRAIKNSPAIWRNAYLPLFTEQISQLHRQEISSSLTNDELISVINKGTQIRNQIWQARQPYLIGGLIAIIALPRLLRFFMSSSDTNRLAHILLLGINHPTAQMNLALRNLTLLAQKTKLVQETIVSSSPKVALSKLKEMQGADHFLKEFYDFLEIYGGRTGALMPSPSMMSWADDPSPIFAILSNTLRTENKDEEKRIQSHNEQYDRVLNQINSRIRRFPYSLFGLRPLFEWTLNRAREITFERDSVVYTWEQAMIPVRHALMELGKRLKDKELINSTQDVRFLHFDEVKMLTLGNLNTQETKEIRTKLEKRKKYRKLSEVSWRVGLVKMTHGKQSENVLKGLAASPGLIEGLARVILSENDFGKLVRGEILVCPATNPSWTPLFAIAGGVVADTGGILSHAAIVAREYGIPAVLATGNATNRITDGERIIVDGDTGQVTLLPT